MADRPAHDARCSGAILSFDFRPTPSPRSLPPPAPDFHPPDCWDPGGSRSRRLLKQHVYTSTKVPLGVGAAFHFAVKGGHQLQALVYDILPSTTAVFNYAIGSRKLSANERFFRWCSNSSKFVTNNSDYIRLVLFCFVFVLYN